MTEQEKMWMDRPTTKPHTLQDERTDYMPLNVFKQIIYSVKMSAGLFLIYEVLHSIFHVI